MISYFELLKRIEKGDIPEKVEVYLTSRSRIYKADYDGSEFSHYFIYDGETDENYHYYLAENFLESSMFDECIEIIEEDKKIEKLNCLVDEDGELTIEGFAFDREQKIQIVNKINEIIEVINNG